MRPILVVTVGQSHIKCDVEVLLYVHRNRSGLLRSRAQPDGHLDFH